MNGKELHEHGGRPFPSVLVLGFTLCLTAFDGRALFAAGFAPAPRVRFDPGTPNVPADVPPQALINEPFVFRVRFKNDPSAPWNVITGYGPFIDLVLDNGGANITKSPACPCDGMIFVKANMISVNGGAVPLGSYQSLAPCPPLPLPPAPVSLPHPFPQVSPVLVPAGAQLVTLVLPFGPYDPNQPEIVVEVTTNVSALADVNPAYPLKIMARGGFRYGRDPLDNPILDPPVVSDVKQAGTPPPNVPSNQEDVSTQWDAQAQTTPTVMIVSKEYLGPEDETATGPNFIQSYAITVDIANGQTVSPVTVTDHLPDNMAYHQMVSSSLPCFLPPFSAPSLPDMVAVPNDLILQCASITGVLGPDAIIVFEFIIPQFDASGMPVLSPTCSFVQSINDIEAEGDWIPSDPCDTSPPPPVPVSSDATPADHTLTDKCLAIQKTVVDLNGGPPGNPIPGDTLQYTLSFQLSDFKTAGNLKVRDVLSDGQTLLTPFTSPLAFLTLTVTDQCGTTSGKIPASAWTQTTLPCSAGAPGEPPARTQVDIDVSAAMISLAPAGGGILTGGYATSPTSNVPATGTIIFQTVINDAYQCPVPAATPPHDQFVDKDDPLTNTVTLTADILTNGGACSTTPTSTGVVATDDSKAVIFIATDFLEKTVYQVQSAAGSLTNCGPAPPCPNNPDVYAGDKVTFRLKKTIPSSDAESLTIQDWLPLPVFNVPPGMTFSFGPDDTLNALATPTFITPPTTPTNSIKFEYGTFNDPTNTPRTIDLLFTLTVSNAPFADGLYLTNEAQECESNTFGVTFCQAAIAQVHLREPALKITKGVVAADNSNAVFSSPVAPPLTFSSPGTASCPRFANGPVSSSYLMSTPLTSDVSSVDANDCVTFAIVVENSGGAPAYDVMLREIFPLGPTDLLTCFAPDFATLCVTDGTGASIPFTTVPGRSLSIAFTNPLPGVGSPPGSNIAVLTFDACVLADIQPHCCDNIARVENYASTSGGPNFVPPVFGVPFQDSAQLCVLPTATKSILATSEAHTSETPVPRPLAIGEIIRFRLKVVVPQTTSASSYQLQDLLPAGLSYLPNTVTASLSPPSSGLTATTFPPVVTGPVPTCNGGTVTFDFGSVTNTTTTPSTQEFIELDFNALVCNTFSNQNGTTLNNSFSILAGGQPVAVSNTVTAVVVEPHITITKNAAVPLLTAGAIATYTITLTNNGTATAFDVRLTDPLPGCLGALSNVQITTAVGVTGVVVNPSPAMLDLTIDSIDVNGTVTVQYAAIVTCVDCNRLINTATVTWTSLRGLFGTSTNATGSSTPGASGSVNGERNGAGGVNDYVASATATLCCMLVNIGTSSCNPDGTFTYTFSVTNFSTVAVNAVSVSGPAGVTITPGLILIPPLLPGLSTTVTVTVGGPGTVSGATICFNVFLKFQEVIVCETVHCITLPKCCVAAPSGMVAWYPLGEAQGASTVNDIAPPFSSLVNNAGTPQPGGLVGAPFGPDAVFPGMVGGAMSFAPGFYVEVPPQSELDFGKWDFAIDAWVRPVHCGSGVSAVVDKFNPVTATGFAFYVAEIVPGLANLYLNINGSTAVSSGTIFTGGAATWSHVAVTVARPPGGSAVGTFYINGFPAGTFTPPSGNVTNALPMWIGKTRIPGQSCPVAIDELEIFNRALGPQAILDIFNAGSAGKCPPAGLQGELVLSPAHLWIGLRNSDDQGTQFDLKVELLQNGTPVASGLQRCITGVTRNPTLAKEAVVAWDAFAPVLLAPDDVLALRASTRIGTRPNDTMCSGPGGSHGSATGLRLYYDSVSRLSRFGAGIRPALTQDLYLHSDGSPCPGGGGQSPGVTARSLDTTLPAATSPRCKDSLGVNFAGGNAFKEIGTWTLP